MIKQEVNKVLDEVSNIREKFQTEIHEVIQNVSNIQKCKYFIWYSKS